MTAKERAESFFEGTTERPLDFVEALAWDLLKELEKIHHLTTAGQHGRECSCTPCRAEDWDAIDQGIARATHAR